MLVIQLYLGTVSGVGGYSSQHNTCKYWKLCFVRVWRVPITTPVYKSLVSLRMYVPVLLRAKHGSSCGMITDAISGVMVP